MSMDTKNPAPAADDGLDVSVVVPTYNEAENIAAIAGSICTALQEAKIRGEVIVVDDDSPDGTGRIAEELGRRLPVRCIVRKGRRGLSSAVLEGFAASRARVCAVMDADGSHPVETLPELVRAVLDGKADIAVGSRYVAGGGCEKWPFLRRVISRGAGLLARPLTSLKDTTSGFMAVRREILDGLPLDPVGWKIVLEVAVKARAARILELPIVFRDRVAGKSKLSARAQLEYLRHLWRLYGFRFAGIFRFARFCLVGLAGMVLDMAIVALLKETLGLDTRLCAIFGFSLAVTSNYLLNRAWTFRDRNVRGIASYPAFVLTSLAGLGVRLGIMHLIIVATSLDQGRGYLLVNFIGILAGTLVNFAGSNLVVFRARR